MVSIISFVRIDFSVRRRLGNGKSSLLINSPFMYNSNLKTGLFLLRKSSNPVR